MSTALLTSEPWLRVVDNGLLIAQATRRLRRKEALPTFIILGVLCAFGFAVCLANDGNPWTGYRGFLFFVMGVFLYLRATTLLVVSVAQERESGLLDFHRATPVTPQSQALGYVFGCAAREWVCCGIMLPFFLGASYFSASLVTDVLCLLVLCVGAVLYQTFAVWLGLVGGISSKRTSSTLMLVIVGVLIAGNVANAAGLATLGHLTPFPLLTALWSGTNTPVDFFGVPIPPLAFSVMVQGHALTFIGWAVTRKLRRGGASSFSRPGALLFMITVVALILGGTWETLQHPSAKAGGESTSVGLMASLYLAGTTGLGMGLLWMVTSDHLEFVRALRRARSLGFRGPGILEEGGASLPMMVLMGVVLLAGFGILMMGQSAVPWDVMLSQSTLLGVLGSLALLAFSSGVGEYTRLSLRGAYKSGVSLLLFGVVVGPLLAGGLLHLVAQQAGLAVWVASLSPVGVALAMVDLTRHWSHVAEESVLIPTLISLASCVVVSVVLHARVLALRSAAALEIPLERPGQR